MKIIFTGEARDTGGKTLCSAVTYGNEEAVEFFLSRPEEFEAVQESVYADGTRDRGNASPLICSFVNSDVNASSSRIVRRLFDAGQICLSTTRGDRIVPSCAPHPSGSSMSSSTRRSFANRQRVKKVCSVL